MPTPNLFLCLILPILIILLGGAVAIVLELRRPTRAEHPANPGGKPW